MAELSTLGSVIKTAYEGEADTNAFTDALQTKLNGISTGATANDTDANLLNRANHTGAQAISTITGLQTDLDAKLVAADIANVVESDATGITGATAIGNIVEISQADYDALTPDAAVTYLING